MRRMGLAAWLVCGLVAGPAVAADSEVTQGPFEVDRVTLSGLSGTLRVEVVEGSGTTLRVKGPEKAVKALEVAEEGGGLEVQAPTGGSSVTVVNSSTVVTGPGATANVRIGGDAGSAGEHVPLDVVLELPRGTGLTLQGFAGEAEIGDLMADVSIGLVDGRAVLGKVKGAALATVGAASIEAASVEGDLEVDVTGDGKVAVAAGTIGDARLKVTGAGTISVDAPIETAEVNMVGAGSVRLAKVEEQPSVQRVGAGELEIGSP